MLILLRRKLAGLTIVAAFFIVATYVLTYQRLSVVNGVSSLINGTYLGSLVHSTTEPQTPWTTLSIDSAAQTTSDLLSNALSTSKASVTTQQATQHKILVVASLKDEDTNWIRGKLFDWPTAIYTVDDPNAKLHTKNKGNEASVYLTYIIENYDNLADVVLFIHSHQTHKHGTKRNRIFQGIDYDNFESIRALKLEFVTRNGFTNLRCLNNPGCPSEIQPFRSEGERDPLRPQEGAMASAWSELFQNEQVPNVLAAPCCAQFAVSKTQIRKRQKSEYERFLMWLYNTPLDDATSGRVFEYLWHVIFGKDAVYCPEEEQCYADQYGTSSALVHEYQNKTMTQADQLQ